MFYLTLYWSVEPRDFATQNLSSSNVFKSSWKFLVSSLASLLRSSLSLMLRVTAGCIYKRLKEWSKTIWTDLHNVWTFLTAKYDLHPHINMRHLISVQVLHCYLFLCRRHLSWYNTPVHLPLNWMFIFWWKLPSDHTACLFRSALCSSTYMYNSP